MEGNQLTSPIVFSQNGQSKDTKTIAESIKLKPVFDDLNKPATFLTHFEQLKNTFEGEKKAVSNPFPVEVFPKAVQEIITATNECLNFPIDFIGASILAAVSVAVGNTHRIEIKTGWQESAVLYITIVGRPGTNKTHPLKWALKPIEKRDNVNYEKYNQEKLLYDSMAALTKKERDQQVYDEPVKPVWAQHLISDFTPEALAGVHSINKRGLCVSVDEFAIWFKNFNRYNKGSEQEFWLSGWSGNTIKINRKTSEPINIPMPFISVVGTIQPGILNELAENRTENGFLDRLLFVAPDNLKRDYWSEAELNPKIADNWSNIVSTLLDLPLILDESGNPKPNILRFSPKAKQRLFQWQRELTDLSNKPENEAISGIYAKMEIYAARLALCLEMTMYACGESDKRSIGIDALEGALQLVEYFCKSALEVRSILSNASPLDGLDEKKRTIYNALPEKFLTGEGLQIAAVGGMPERSFKRFLTNRDLFFSGERGEYEKLV